LKHRHTNDTGYTLTAIDSIIERGKRPDWAELQIAMRSNPEICLDVLHMAKHNLEHPYTIRYHYWYFLAMKYLSKKNPVELHDEEILEWIRLGDISNAGRWKERDFHDD
jgi:hypothetical protein